MAGGSGFTNLTISPISDSALRIWNEVIGTYEQDIANIMAGRYRLPYDQTELRHKQFSPSYIARQSVRFFREAADTLERKQKAGNGPSGPSIAQGILATMREQGNETFEFVSQLCTDNFELWNF